MNAATIIALVVAIISASISVLTAILPAWLSQLWLRQADSAKAKALFNSKKEPLLVATMRLARELHNFLDRPLPQSTWVLDCDAGKRAHATNYMCYLFAVYFARVEELHKTTGFLNLEGENRRLLAVLYRLQRVLMWEYEDPAEGQDEVPGLLRRSDVELMVEMVTVPPVKTEDESEEAKNRSGSLKVYESFANSFGKDNWQVWGPFIELYRPWKEKGVSTKNANIFLTEYEALVLSKDDWVLLSEVDAPPASTTGFASSLERRESYDSGGVDMRTVTLLRLPGTTSKRSHGKDKVQKEILSGSNRTTRSEVDRSKSNSAPIPHEESHAVSRSDETTCTFQDIRANILTTYDKLLGLTEPGSVNDSNNFRPLLLGLNLIGYQQVWNYLAHQKAGPPATEYHASPLKIELRFRKFQHRLVELIVALDPQSKRILSGTEDDHYTPKGRRTKSAEYMGNILPVRIAAKECGCQLSGYCKPLQSKLRNEAVKSKLPNKGVQSKLRNKTHDLEAHHEKASHRQTLGWLHWLLTCLNPAANSKPSKSERRKRTPSAEEINVPLRSPGDFEATLPQKHDSTHDTAKLTAILKDAPNRYQEPLKNAVLKSEVMAKIRSERREKAEAMKRADMKRWEEDIAPRNLQDDGAGASSRPNLGEIS